jgi:hypothetical protein
MHNPVAMSAGIAALGVWPIQRAEEGGFFAVLPWIVNASNIQQSRNTQPGFGN